MADPDYLPFHPNPKKPDYKPPQLACDAHCHVFGPGDVFPYSPTSTYIPVDAPKQKLYELHKYLGFERSVIVQASCHGRDNRAMVDALRSGGGHYKGIAIIDPNIDQAELNDMDQAGVRGTRVNFVRRLGGAGKLEDIKRAISRIEPLGWHTVVYFEPGDFAEQEAFISEIPTPVVIDHMGRVDVAEGIGSAHFKKLCALLDRRKDVWIKVSCPERLTKQGPPYDDIRPVAQAFVELFPQQTLWGTDWPHPNMKSHMPDDGLLVDLLPKIAPTEELRQALLVDNPARLYWDA